MNQASEYPYHSAEPTWLDDFLWREVRRGLLRHVPPPATVFEIGCGNGSVARRIAELGYSVLATDASASAISAARSAGTDIRFEIADVYDSLDARFGAFDAVVALEVVEHLYDPRALPRRAHDLLKPGGFAFFSTPYHGWLKNLLIAGFGRFDRHFDPLWDHGHIKFFSPATLRALVADAGLAEVRLERLGRIPVLARSMLLTARREAP